MAGESVKGAPADASPGTPPSMGRGVSQLTRSNIRLAVQIGLISFLAYVLGTGFTSLFHNASANIGALWCAITGIAVLQSTTRGTWREGIRQLGGTLVGVIVGGLYLSFFPFNPIGMGVCVLITVLFCALLGISDTSKLAGTSVVMIMLISTSNSDLTPLENSSLRFAEACIGAGIAMVVALLSLRVPETR